MACILNLMGNILFGLHSVLNTHTHTHTHVMHLERQTDYRLLVQVSLTLSLPTVTPGTSHIYIVYLVLKTFVFASPLKGE